MGIDGLEETECNPGINSNNVEIPHKVAVQQRAGNSSGTEDKNLSRMCVFCCKPERRRVLVVNLMDVLV